MTTLPTTALSHASADGRLAFYTFRAAGRLYGADVLQIQEVCPCPPVTPVPQAPSAVRGLTNLRSHIYLALDMRSIVGGPALGRDVESRLIIVKSSVAADLGVIVEQGGDIVHVSASRLEAPPRVGETEIMSALLPSVLRLESELMTVVDLAVLAAIVQAQFGQAHHGSSARGAAVRAFESPSRETSQ